MHLVFLGCYCWGCSHFLRCLIFRSNGGNDVCSHDNDIVVLDVAVHVCQLCWLKRLVGVSRVQVIAGSLSYCLILCRLFFLV